MPLGSDKLGSDKLGSDKLGSDKLDADSPDRFNSADGGWLRPETIAPANSYGEGSTAALYDLRPLSLGEVLDRTFLLYRSRFWLFCSITAVSASVQVLVQAIALATTHRVRNAPVLTASDTSPAAVLHALSSAQRGTLLPVLVFVLVSAIANAATTLALSEVYLNHPVSARQTLTAALRHWYRWAAIGLWQVGSMLWIFVLTLVLGGILTTVGASTRNPALTATGAFVILAGIFAGLPAGYVLFLRNCLAVPAAMVEKLTVRAAMRRSKTLAAGSKGRIFVVLLISGVLYSVVAVLESPASLLLYFAPQRQHYLAQAISLILSFLGHTLVTPVGLIGLTLLYFDQRVRKEALDLQMLLEASRGDGTTATQAASAAAPRLTPLG